MFGFLLRAFFLGAFLASCFSDILGGALRGAKNGTGDNHNCGEAQASRKRRTPHRKREGGQHWDLEISSLHSKPTTGGHRLGKEYSEKGRLLELNLFTGRSRLSAGVTEEVPEFFDVSTGIFMVTFTDSFSGSVQPFPMFSL